MFNVFYSTCNVAKNSILKIDKTKYTKSLPNKAPFRNKINFVKKLRIKIFFLNIDIKFIYLSFPRYEKCF